jgi:asparagine synthase (glutamine-hydrolysing)
MCGIAGGVFRGDSVPRSTAVASVEAMVGRLAHRGPDGRGLYASIDDPDVRGPFAVLGHTRLAIIDVSDAGAQPMGGGPGQSHPWITFNGEIYNFAQLRTELEGLGASFRSHSDTEVILRGYDAWGLDVLQRLRGMYAFALWDPSRHRLLIARDRLGIKPVYIYRGDGFLLFASEVRALLATGLVPRRLDPTAVWQYLGYQAVPAPRTLVEHVRALEPASWMTIDQDGTVGSGTYWDMLDSAAVRDLSDSDAKRLVGDRLRDSVAAHMVSDVPVAAFLSGGIDSSAVVGLMREAGATPRTFSVGFDEQRFDESEHAALVARTFHAEHTHLPLTARDLLDQLPSALCAMDQPTGDAVNTYVVSAAVRAHGIKVALSGLGGDEVFGGYPSFARLQRVADVSRLWGLSPDPVRRAAAAAVRTIGGRSIAAGKTAALLESDGTISSMFPVMRQVLSVAQRTALLSATMLQSIEDRDDPYDRLLAREFARHPLVSTFSQISFAEARTYMHDVLLRDTDQMSMAHGLEVRVPLLDHELVELVLSVPDRSKQSANVPKRLLVDALGGMLPTSIVRRPKQGFTLPFDPWMKGPLKELCEERLGERGLSGRGLLDGAALRGLWQSFLAGSSDVSWSRLWTLVVLDAWIDQCGVAA